MVQNEAAFFGVCGFALAHTFLIYGGILMAKKLKKVIPKSIEKCFRKDKFSRTLWFWGKRIEKLGKILFFILIIKGVFLAVSTSILKTRYFGYQFNYLNFFGVLLNYLIYVLIEYCAYHALTLLICSLACIVRYMNISVRMALLNSSVCREEINADSAEPNPGSADKPTDEAHSGKDGLFETDTCPD